jgi:serine/threonine protein kinase
MYLHKIKH